MEKDYPRPMQETYNAAKEAATKLNLKISSDQYGPTESKIEATTQDGTRCKVELVARPNGITPSRSASHDGQRRLVGYYHRQIMKILRIPDQP